MMVKFLSEHDVAYIVQLHHAQEIALSIGDREDVSLRIGYGTYHLPQIHLRMHHVEVLLYHAVHFHQRKYSLIFMMREQLTLLSQSHRVDAMRLKEEDGQVRHHRDNHQGQEKIIPTCEFCNEKYTRERGVHHTAHQASHAHKGKVFLWQSNRRSIAIEKMSKDKPHDTTEKE